MTKKRDDAECWTPKGEFDRELTALSREHTLPHNPPPGLKWHAILGIMRIDLNGAETRCLWCMVSHASMESGLCFPSQERIAHLLNMPERTVRRAAFSLKRKGLITIVTRPSKKGRRNFYIINWKPLFAAFASMVAAQEDRPRVAATPPRDRPDVDGGDRPLMAPTSAQKVAKSPLDIKPYGEAPRAELLKGEPLKKYNHKPERVSPRADTGNSLRISLMASSCLTDPRGLQEKRRVAR
jgi:hypothetical protein